MAQRLVANSWDKDSFNCQGIYFQLLALAAAWLRMEGIIEIRASIPEKLSHEWSDKDQRIIWQISLPRQPPYTHQTEHRINQPHQRNTRQNPRVIRALTASGAQ